MKWIQNFQLFLFDFDGLLVDTERLHYRAYIEMLAKRKITLDWSFAKFCGFAHLTATALKEAIYTEHPSVDPDWDSLYADKKRTYLELLQKGDLALMPGVEELLSALKEQNISRCVVTHSPKEQIDQITSRLPILRSIPHWITRGDYAEPKPHPECYLKAIELYGNPGDQIIGFEDSIRGWQALKKTRARPILICPPDHPLLPDAIREGAIHYESFQKIDF